MTYGNRNPKPTNSITGHHEIARFQNDGSRWYCKVCRLESVHRFRLEVSRCPGPLTRPEPNLGPGGDGELGGMMHGRMD